MSANTAQQKAPWILAALLLSQVVLMSTNARHPDSEQSVLRIWLVTGFAPVVRVADAVLSSVKGTGASYVDVRHAREENLELREKVDQLTAERNNALERAAELDRLRTQLALPPRPQYRELAANVISRNASLWFRRLTIDRGTLDGVKRDMPVATAGGIVGRVISVGPNFAMVQVITDKHAGVGAMLQASRAMGEIRGLDNDRCELKNISTSEKVEVGESVVTTGLDRIYPKGLLVGTVERIEADPNAPWHKIVVKPAAPVDRVEHVLVLLVEPKDLKIDGIEVKQ
ncbi:MAG TPA: rod shape-determining protein MreC [Blastocatellia bacterium]|nr:rod shape-determining protein MreC [Blastocatellia bacterium]